LNKRRSSAELSRQLEEEQQMLARLQAEQDEEARLKEERERQERERREFERQKRELERDKERAERERRELEEERRRTREKAERMTSAEEEERRRQKELLLAKMKAIDDGAINSSDAAGSPSQTMNGPTISKRAVAAEDDVNGAASDQCRPSSLTETATSDPVGPSDLVGPPSQKLTSTKRRVVADDDDVNGAVFGGYRPSFLAGSTSSAKTKKTSSGTRRDAAAASRPRRNLLVFDDDDDNDDFTQTSNSEKPASPDLSFLSGHSSQGEVGAGDTQSKHLLPRRPRKQATTKNGVVNDLSDEIEEVIF